MTVQAAWVKRFMRYLWGLVCNATNTDAQVLARCAGALIARCMTEPARTGSVERKTAETAIAISVNLDGTGTYDVSTGIGFLDHMVEQFSKHSLIDVSMKVEGDLHVDQHHTTEDSAIALGQALTDALS